ncbi:DUF3040 domain-containing protein [Kitasatospora sp. NPDC048540]|uniref:DUF3040 domain-containing protein n=1 Tax=unclassified Kitasatospora TaxID=2633591 RepID=UPI00053AB2DE|nr:DUF3040 domain-containing protein [Kitasatospora sp. MBT63]
MDGSSMSGQERQILQSIEEHLRSDTRLDRRLSTMTPAWTVRARTALLAVRATTVVMLLMGAALCLAAAVREPTAAVLVVLGLAWAAALTALAGLIGRRRRRTR